MGINVNEQKVLDQSMESFKMVVDKINNLNRKSVEIIDSLLPENNSE